MDFIFCMALTQKYIVMQMYPELANRIYTLREYIKEDEITKDIKDPFGGYEDTYEKCTEEIKMCLEELIKLF